MYKLLKNICRFIAFFIFRIRINGKENFPTEEIPFIIASNHSSILDPIMVAFITKREIHFMAKAELFKTKFTKWLFESVNCISVDRKKNDITAIKKSLKVLRDGKILGIFPEGTRRSEEDDLAAKQGVILLAHKAKCDILPVSVKSKFKLFSVVEINILPMFKMQEYISEDNNCDYEKVSNKLLETIYKGADQN